MSEITKGLTSIIMATYDNHALLRRITSASLHNIEKYTDKEDYELILVDNEFNDASLDKRYHRWDLDYYIFNEKDKGYSASCNQAAELAKGEYLCFIHNDVFVWEGWLPKLREYLEKDICDVVWPHQGPTPRDYVKESYEKDLQANDDAGITFMRRSDFDMVGGWDERFFGALNEIAFRRKYTSKGLRTLSTSRVIITHIGGGVALADQERFQKQYGDEGKILHAE